MGPECNTREARRQEGRVVPEVYLLVERTPVLVYAHLAVQIYPEAATEFYKSVLNLSDLGTDDINTED